jgi:hypothetical protein
MPYAQSLVHPLFPAVPSSSMNSQREPLVASANLLFLHDATAGHVASTWVLWYCKYARTLGNAACIPVGILERAVCFLKVCLAA